MLTLSQEKISALKKQANHIVQQAQREQDHFIKEKNNLLMMLQRVGIFPDLLKTQVNSNNPVTNIVV